MKNTPLLRLRPRAVTSPWGAFGGLTPLRKAPTPQMETWNNINQLSFFLLIFWVSSPLTQTQSPLAEMQSPPIENFLATVLAQDQVIWVEMAWKLPHLWCHPQKNCHPKLKIFFISNYKTRRVFWDWEFKQLSSTNDWRAMELQSAAKIQDLHINLPGSKGVNVAWF